MANTTVNIDIQVQSKSLGALEKELAQINDELKDVQIGSAAFKELSAKSQEVTKELEKANKAVQGFTAEDKFMAADGAIKAMGGSLAGVVGALGLIGVESEVFGEFEKKAASAIAVAVGVKDISEGYKQLKQSTVLATAATKLFGTTAKAALAATGIGLFVVALGTIVSYWDEISASVNGVSGELEDQLTTQEELVTASEDQYNAISAMENTLKLAGKSEKEIRDLKIQQTNETITALEAQLTTQKEVKKAQIDAATRNQKIAAGVIAFLTAPITLLLGAVDALTYGLEKVGVLSEATNLAEGFAMGAASLIFDPASIAEEGDAAIAETEKKLTELKNRRDGFVLQNQAEEKAQREKAQSDKDAADQKAADAEKKRLEDLAALKAEIRNAEANTLAEQRAKELEDTQTYYDELIAKAEAEGLATEELERSKRERLLELQTEYDTYDTEQAQKKADELKRIQDEEAENAQKIVDAKLQAQLDLAAGVGAAIGALGGLFKEGTAAAKTAALAELAIGTGVGFINALDIAQKSAKGTGPAAAFAFPIFYATQIAAVLGAVGKAKAILKTVPGGGGSGGTTAPSSGAPGGGRTTPQNQTPQAPQFETVAPAVRTYVLAGDVTTSQEADARLNRKRTLGS